jgi:hypothetical protein
MSSPLQQSNAPPGFESTPRLVRHPGFGPIVILCGCLAFGAGPCLGQILPGEADAAGKECESSEHLALCAPGSHHGGKNEHSVAVQVATHRGRSDCTARRSLPFHCGHRLSNGLRAPLRC